ncbi:MAG TPA: 30S ribosomal protein S16 [Candidatus Saccharimonadales bacterium]|nr:30S ribosomal protein S16 [Candidatus Saccharimonadales bacterium]
MLAIRLQRIGRKGHPVYRLAVQEAQRHPSSGRVVAYVGSYDPHSKATKLNHEEVDKYLANGAQPSPRVVRLLQNEKVKLPKWVQLPEAKNRAIKNLEKLRKNRPAEEAPVEQPAEEAAPAEAEANSEA